MPSLAVALHLRAWELRGPAAIIKDLDEALKQITNPATFVTMFYARLNQTSRTLEYVSGGHNPPILVRPKTGESLLLEQAGPIVGILPDAQFSNTVIALEQGDILTLFTDGVTEQENENGEEFSVDRLKEVILKAETEPAGRCGSPYRPGCLRLCGSERADRRSNGCKGEGSLKMSRFRIPLTSSIWRLRYGRLRTP
jgi:serine phosphatase RsbU (regulator of sigma subunit)